MENSLILLALHLKEKKDNKIKSEKNKYSSG